VLWDVAPFNPVNIKRSFREYRPKDGGIKHLRNASICQIILRNTQQGMTTRCSPCTAQLPGLVPHFLHIWIVLDYDGVLDVAAAGCGCPIHTRCVVIRRGRHTAAVQVDLEGGAEMSRAWLQMHAVRVTVEPYNTRVTLVIEVCRHVE
jgi:hypothetical protein